jgi:5-oxoprolinase (ATP-hydrolysing)
MRHVRENASQQVQEALGRIKDGHYHFKDQMDDGTAIRVRITTKDHRAVIDFTGTASESKSNLNAPHAVVHSCVLYFLRCLVTERIPLNDGCFSPITIIIPERSLLNPLPGHAVVGGNVETSQRIVDILFGALKLTAASQGTMNNLVFGNKHFGYYETIAGGAGAAKGYHGASEVHTHMTNTRITDPEILETQFPVQLLGFSIREGSGGKGRFYGGNGIVRKFRFLKGLEVSILSQRRSTSPFGLAGGYPGKRRENIRILPNGKEIKQKGKALYRTRHGEVLIICTPGGGGYGKMYSK